MSQRKRKIAHKTKYPAGPTVSVSIAKESNPKTGENVNTDDKVPLPSCCAPVRERKHEGFLWGLFYGLVPHTFCILFVVLSVIGATAATSMLKPLLYLPYFFQIIIALSFMFATVSAAFYLRRNGLLSAAGLKAKWRYLTIMYGTTIAINLLFFMVIFPAVANINSAASAEALDSVGVAQVSSTAAQPSVALQSVTLQVRIPCPGHAPLIISELQEAKGVRRVRFQGGNLFQVTYDAGQISPKEILAQEVFKSFPAKLRS